jgi:putative spermidine/putrescine transport system permease protein
MKFRTETWGFLAVRAAAILVLMFLVLPLIFVFITAFNHSAYMQFPPTRWSLRWFNQYFESSRWMAATWMSFKLGIVVSIIGTALGLGSAIVLNRFVFPGRRVLRAAIMAPLVVPVIVLAAGLYYTFVSIGLNGTFASLALGHAVVAFPYATIVIGASLEQTDRRIEDAAVGLGAPRARAFVEITLPIIRSSIIVSALFCFLISFDEVVISVFLAGPESTTLPRVMWDSIRFEISPTIAAVSSMLTVLSTAIMAVAEGARAHLERKRSTNVGVPT